MSLLLAQRLGVKLGRLSFEWPRRHPSWGYERIVGEVKAQGHRTSRSSVARVSKENGIGPAPDRPSSWSAFIKAARGENAAADFFTTEVWTPKAAGDVLHAVRDRFGEPKGTYRGNDCGLG